MVFSAEHYASIVHNWVCWAAPVHDPVTGAQARRHRPLDHLGPHPPDRPRDRPGDGPADRDRDAALGPPPLRRWLDETAEPGLVMTLLGTAETWLDGQRLLLNRRQTEVLALLAMHPEGLSLEHLHALVYGDQAVTFSTLKAEVSHLRAALGGQLGSRPYRLMMPVATDVDHVLAAAAPRPGRRRRRRLRRRPAARHQLPGPHRARRVRRGRGPRGAARRPAARRRGPLRRAGAVRHRGGRGLPGLDAVGGHPHPAVPLLKGRLAAARR